MTIDIHSRNIGVNYRQNGEAEVVLWAPHAREAVLETPTAKISLEPQAYGFWKASARDLPPGTAYRISLDQRKSLPDPASLSQPRGVHEASETVDLRDFNWLDAGWKNLPSDAYIIYELHAGTFSPGHDFDGIIQKLDHLAVLGITAIEVMPVGQFPGSRNWGYDGVFPFAVQESYGGVRGLQRLVDACHAKGIAVILDVIYNHLGPEGNYLGQFGPYFTDKYHTPWGKALNFDDAWCDGVRHYFIENALMWFRDFHIDALRLDAVHAIKDLSPVHIVKEIRQYVDQLSNLTGRQHYLITELDLNDPVFINPIANCGYGADGQWVDEFHHALRVSAGQPREGYYSDFNGIMDLAKSYNDAYVYDGQFSEHRKKFFGKKTKNPGHQFVVFSQNHDQVGNRMLGERSGTLVSREMVKLMAGAVLVSPFLPMLFMGEEWGETNPFLFFISHTDQELAALVNKGRKEEFSYFNWQGEAPDPRLEKTFDDSCLQWQLLTAPGHRELLAYYKELIRLRKKTPALANSDRQAAQAAADESTQTLLLHRHHSHQHVLCAMNFSQSPQTIDGGGSWQLLLDSSLQTWGGQRRQEGNSGPINALTLAPESIMILEATA